jgi:hypothetical protein
MEAKAFDKIANLAPGAFGPRRKLYVLEDA